MQYLIKRSFIWLGLIVLLPLLLNAPFNAPSIDDFCFTQRSLEFGFWGSQRHWYVEWLGRYSSTFLLSLYGYVSNSFVGYALFPILFIALLYHSFFRFIGTAFMHQTTDVERHSIVIGILALYVYQMPSLAHGFYWLSGSVTYMLPIILMLYLLGHIFENWQAARSKMIYGAAGFASMVVSSSNETAMTTWLFMLGVLFLLKVVKDKKNDWFLLYLLTVSTISSIIVIAAPGNLVRLSTYTVSNNPFFPVFASWLASAWYVKIWLISSPATLFLIAYLPLGVKLAPKLHKSVVFSLPPALMIAFTATAYWSTYFPGYWSMGTLPKRTINFSYIVFLTGALFSVQSIISLAVSKYAKNNRNTLGQSDQQRYKPLIYNLLPMFLYGFLLVGTIFFFLRPNNIQTAYLDFFSGKSRAYGKEVANRKTKLLTCEKNCKLSPYMHRPKTIFWADITSDPTYWANKCYAGAYKKESIILRE